MAATPRCVLKNLDNPMLNGILLGLGVDEGKLALQGQMFPCCAAQGMTWDDRTGGYYSCDLRSRLHRLQKLWAQYQRLWPSSSRLPHQMTAAQAAQLLQELAAVFKHDRPPGHVQYSSQKQQPSTLWPRALAATWRFGLEARVLNLQQAALTDLNSFTGESQGPLVLFVEQIDKLWDPLMVEHLEHVIQCAYNAEAFLWLEFLTEQTQDETHSHDLSARAVFTRKIAQLRQKHPLSFLSRDCLSRLDSLCGTLVRSDL